MTTSIGGTTGVTFNDASVQATAATGFGFKNRIINGAMVIDQRNAGASVTPVNGAFTLDRWKARLSQTSKYSVQQSSTTTTGFTKSLLATSLSAYSVGSGELFVLEQVVEGYNIADLAWGTASASPVTLLFWVRSSLTGTFGGSLSNSARDRSYPFSYTISAADTWEQKSVTIAGDTTGTWLTDSGKGIEVCFSLGSGSTYSGTANTWAAADYRSATGATSVVGTNGATFYITGVQLEKGSTATSFDYRPYGTELDLCMRYYYKTVPITSGRFGVGFTSGTTVADILVNFPTTMRSEPTALEQSGTAANYVLVHGATSTASSAVPVFQGATNQAGSIRITVASGLTLGQGCMLRSLNTSGYVAWSAEL